ncbi:DUF6053 domain-containing protein [Lysobacter enzymogenes]
MPHRAGTPFAVVGGPSGPMPFAQAAPTWHKSIGPEGPPTTAKGIGPQPP